MFAVNSDENLLFSLNLVLRLPFFLLTVFAELTLVKNRDMHKRNKKSLRQARQFFLCKQQEHRVWGGQKQYTIYGTASWWPASQQINILFHLNKIEQKTFYGFYFLLYLCVCYCQSLCVFYCLCVYVNSMKSGVNDFNNDQ